MSVETLRRAAAELRADSQTTAGGEPCEPDEFGLAVADWLEAVAKHATNGTAGRKTNAKALAVANAYLGETTP